VRKIKEGNCVSFLQNNQNFTGEFIHHMTSFLYFFGVQCFMGLRMLFIHYYLVAHCSFLILDSCLLSQLAPPLKNKNESLTTQITTLTNYLLSNSERLRLKAQRIRPHHTPHTKNNNSTSPRPRLSTP
jgi:hypothetical protein